jgi:hypothetical protein
MLQPTNYHLKKVFGDSDVRRTCHNFGYGVGDDMDELLAEHGVDD